MSSAVTVLWAFLSLTTLLALYIYTNDRKITRLPDNYDSFTTKTRTTTGEVRATAARLAKRPPSIDDQLPPKTGRRYIVVGGGGFLGGWIATQLLDRGEHPTHIRLLDIRPPPSITLQNALKRGVQFIPVNVSDTSAVCAAFSSPWPSSVPQSTEITVFHTAANIRFYERYTWQLPLSAKVNVDGTKNVIDAAKKIGATTLVYTSSGSVGIRSNRFLLWPWERSPRFFTQIIRDEDQERERTWKHEDFFSNYAASKSIAERLVRGANKQPIHSDASSPPKVLLTGCIRPGNGIFGPRGDMLCGAYVARKMNPTWIQGLISSHCYVENCALAHLLYEQRLIALSHSNPNSSTTLPDISGQAFNVCDPGSTPTNGDVFTTLTTLTNGECHFHFLPPTFMLLFAYLIEFYYTLPSFFNTYLKFPRITGNLINLQPSLFSLTQIHLIFDDYRARLEPEKGGLGYRGAWTTLEALHKTVEEHYKSLSDGSVRADKAGINLDFKFGFGWGRKRSSTKNAVGGTVKPKVVEAVEVSGKEVVDALAPVEVVSLQ
ncbi:3beta-hydroxysteroid-dehydrogenase/decarboxylase isoform 1 [Leucoagaricus sp. SymC.cos]|nr:3beta-hydroxysteroid-dehydrogenase/decarboxylase isoform 1 [Leucoagaricus sp. SymC.cos]